jgi:predicted dehydrogenase
VNINVEKAHEFAVRWGASSWGSDPKLLLGDDIIAVHVCTPPNLHYEMVRFLLENKKHVLCEKPLCLEPWQAEELAALAEENNLTCAVNLNVRYHAACQRARQLVKEPDFGLVLLVHGSYLQEFHALPAPTDWRYDEKLAGQMRAVTEIGTHWLDLAEYISGKRIRSLSALFGNFHPKRNVENGMMHLDSLAKKGDRINVSSEDSALIHFRFEDNALGSVVLSEVSHGRLNHLSIEITGEKKNLWWNSEQSTQLHTSKKGEGVNTELFAFGNSSFTDTFQALISNYYTSLNLCTVSQSIKPPTLLDGERLVRLCNAIGKSACQNAAWVEIDF